MPRVTPLMALLLPTITFAQAISTSPIQSPAQVSAYWTAERLSEARPMPLRRVAGTPTAAPASLVQGPRTPITSPSASPKGGGAGPLERVAREPQAPEPVFGPGSTVWYDYPPPSTLNVPVLDYAVIPSFPNTATGKLFFSQAGGNFVCSAQAVSSAGTWGAGNGQTLVTAGHCCSNGAGIFSTNMTYQPAHLNGAAPLGTWSAYLWRVYTEWHNGADLSVDYCVVQMSPRAGRNLHAVTGYLGYAANLPLPQHYTATGWPAAAPFTGGLLYHASASDAETDTAAAGLLPYTHGIGNAMTGGSSGGAWIRNYQSLVPGANTNLFNGLNSYKYTTPARPAEMFGPYIDTLFVSLLESVAIEAPAP